MSSPRRYCLLVGETKEADIRYSKILLNTCLEYSIKNEKLHTLQLYSECAKGMEFSCKLCVSAPLRVE